MGAFIMPNGLINIEIPKRFRYILIAGPNGSGKTTLADLLLGNLGIECINQDRIKAALEKECGHSLHVNVASCHAGRRMSELFAQGDTFAFETTLDARNPLSILSNPQTYHYETTIIYVVPLSVEDCIKNVHQRVENNGHGVPEDKIRERYTKSMNNFYDLSSSQLVHSWCLYLNDYKAEDDKPKYDKKTPKNTHKLVASSYKGNIQLVRPELVELLPQPLGGIFTGMCH